MAVLRTAKQELRRAIAAKTAEVQPESLKNQSSRVTSTLLSNAHYGAAQRISIYLSMPHGEIDTSDIILDAFSKGKDVFVPYIHKNTTKKPEQPDSTMEMLRLHSMSDFKSLKRDKWGIPSLDSASAVTRENCFGGSGVRSDSRSTADISSVGRGLDLVLVPGQAFDSSFGRLGHGKGFYDFFFARCEEQTRAKKLPMPHLIGLSLNEQLLEGSIVPMGQTDWRLDAIILGDGRALRRE